MRARGFERAVALAEVTALAGVAGVALWVAAGAGLAHAQQSEPLPAGSEEMALSPPAENRPDSDVGLSVVLAYGSADEGLIDPDLADMQQYLEKRFPMKLGTLEAVSSQRVGLTFGETSALSLPTGDEINVLPIAVLNGQLHLYLEMPGVNTRMRIQSGRPVILGGTPWRSGSVLVQITPSFHSGPTEDELERQPTGLAERPPKPLLDGQPGGPGMGDSEIVNDRR